MDSHPEKPGDESLGFQMREVGYGLIASDGCQSTFITIMER
jgi:hypothetical protein